MAVKSALAESSSTSPSHDFYFTEDKRPIVLFDGVCNFCNGGVNFMMDWDTKGKVRVVSLQSKHGKNLLRLCGRRSDDISSIVFIQENRFSIKSEAILDIGKCLNMPLPVLCTLLTLFPAFFRDAAYDVVSENRYAVFGSIEACRIPDPKFQNRFIPDLE
eukprot:CAMPEP_0196580516 /NCGR_PEP_ID=MMETSP1081-20130531/28958_1 /TAXON_ID=36882 /ORGANISM="Pyramimonas amylifera, Strain CCMP720" /LENGTH=159 /DNA_ID=CAMNT_0041900397 /DNA_START=325 /DNA_END=804 /DNA_ORIENTATION=-